MDITYGDDHHVTLEIPIDAFVGDYDALLDRYAKLMAPILAFAKLLAITGPKVEAFAPTGP